MKIGRNEECWCGSGKKYKKCHAETDERMSKLRREGYEVPNRKLLKTPAQIAGIAESSKINIAALDLMGEHVQPGITTEELDRLIHEKTVAMGGIPAPLHYKGFPKSTCISINEVVCHGIPSKKTVLREGDIVNIDVSTIYQGFYSDSSRMFCVGKVSAEKQKLVETARECMELGVAAVNPWGFLGDVGEAVNAHAGKNGYTIVREIGGHGIGLQFHEEPFVSYVTHGGTGMVLVPGLTFTVEPMVNMGKAQVHTDERDGWTVTTADGQPSAQWEKTVCVTEDGCRVLTY